MTRRGVLLALVGATGAVVGAAFAQRAAVPKQQDKAALAEANAKELLLVMDTDKSGKISKQEWIMDEVHGGEIRQIGQGQERGDRSKGINAIEGVGQA